VRHTTNMHTGTSMVQQHAVALRWSLCCAACLKQPCQPSSMPALVRHMAGLPFSWLLCAGGTAAAAGKGDSAAAHTGQAASGSAPGAACDGAAEDTGSSCATQDMGPQQRRQGAVGSAYACAAAQALLAALRKLRKRSKEFPIQHMCTGRSVSGNAVDADAACLQLPRATSNRHMSHCGCSTC
jgi:hypothetical protein